MHPASLPDDEVCSSVRKLRQKNTKQTKTAMLNTEALGHRHIATVQHFPFINSATRSIHEWIFHELPQCHEQNSEYVHTQPPCLMMKSAAVSASS